MIVMRSGLIIIVLAGCNPLLGIDETVIASDGGGDGGGGGGNVCDPLPYDRARYTYGAFGAISWASGRSLCSSNHGMDLVVVNTGEASEIAQVFNLGSPPYWTGISFDGTAWTSIDTCTPALAWAPGEPVTERIGDCALRTAGGLASAPCTSVVHANSAPIQALCETPRPSPSCLALQSRSTYMRLGGGNELYTDAKNGCTEQGMHLVEINSSAELEHVKQMFPGVAFWTGAYHTTDTWTSPTGCPQIFPWRGPTEPRFNAGSCAFHDSGGMGVGSCNSVDMFEAICESNT